MSTDRQTYRAGAKIRFVVPDEPPPTSVVIDDDGTAWQYWPGPDVERPWKSTTGEQATWVELVTRGELKIVHVGQEENRTP